MSYSLFTSESVAAGHPDKIADAISDAILDALLLQDPYSRAGIETIVGSETIGLFGEIKSTATVDFEAVARATVARLGYTNKTWHFSDRATVINRIHQQSPDIAVGVDADGAGDQGMMFGYANNETEQYMPLPISLAHALTRQLDYARESALVAWLRPDGKSQVTVAYKDGKPVGIHTIVMAVAHDEMVTQAEVKKDIVELVIKPTLQGFGFDSFKTEIIINGTGVWHIPGPDSDAGLTGRKIVVDGYGGYARVGGGAFSGKDPSKVDRSGAYAARYIAKNIVANGLAEQCEVALAYVIGKPAPVMRAINCFDTAKLTQRDIEAYATKLLDTSVKGIIEGLDLRRPIYSETSAYGHFGKEGLPWEAVVTSRD